MSSSAPVLVQICTSAGADLHQCHVQICTSAVRKICISGACLV
jgi:hypothetical protein